MLANYPESVSLHLIGITAMVPLHPLQKSPKIIGTDEAFHHQKGVQISFSKKLEIILGYIFQIDKAMANKSRREMDSETMTFKLCEQKLKSCTA